MKNSLRTTRRGAALSAAVVERCRRHNIKGVLVANALRESQERNQRDATILEVGLRHLVTEGVILGGAVGTGIGRDSPRFSAILSLQFALAGG